MKGIRFKAKDVKTGEWIYGYYVEQHMPDYDNDIPDRITGYTHLPMIFNGEPGNRDKCYWREVKHETVCQFTGKKDKNGKPIYEGDIIRSDNYPFSDGEEKDNYIGIVFWTESENLHQVMQFASKQCERRGISNFINKAFYDMDFTQTEVIGNIHDRQELFRDSVDDIMRWYITE